MRHKLPLFFACVLVSELALAGGAACVMAKYQGETMDYALVYGRAHPADAQEAAMAELRDKGYGDYLRHLDVMRAQNLSNNDHAYVIVIRSDFKDWRGKERSAMGCLGSNPQVKTCQIRGNLRRVRSGERYAMAIPSQATEHSGEGVETRRQAPSSEG